MGKHIPFIAAQSIPLGLATVAFFYPPMGNNTITFIYLAVVGSLFFTFYTIVGAPYNALIPEIGNTMKKGLIFQPGSLCSEFYTLLLQ